MLCRLPMFEILAKHFQRSGLGSQNVNVRQAVGILGRLRSARRKLGLFRKGVLGFIFHGRGRHGWIQARQCIRSRTALVFTNLFQNIIFCQSRTGRNRSASTQGKIFLRQAIKSRIESTHAIGKVIGNPTQESQRIIVVRASKCEHIEFGADKNTQSIGRQF